MYSDTLFGIWILRTRRRPFEVLLEFAFCIPSLVDGQFHHLFSGHNYLQLVGEFLLPTGEAFRNWDADI